MENESTARYGEDGGWMLIEQPVADSRQQTPDVEESTNGGEYKKLSYEPTTFDAKPYEDMAAESDNRWKRQKEESALQYIASRTAKPKIKKDNGGIGAGIADALTALAEGLSVGRGGLVKERRENAFGEYIKRRKGEESTYQKNLQLWRKNESDALKQRSARDASIDRSHDGEKAAIGRARVKAEDSHRTNEQKRKDNVERYNANVENKRQEAKNRQADTEKNIRLRGQYRKYSGGSGAKSYKPVQWNEEAKAREGLEDLYQSGVISKKEYNGALHDGDKKANAASIIASYRMYSKRVKK